MYLIY